MSVLLCLWLLWSLATERQRPLILHDNRSFECRTLATDPSLPRFHIQTIHHAGSEPLSQRLCRSDVMSSFYGTVETLWQQRGKLSARDIVEERYDLFWNRDRRVQSLVPNFDQYYEPLLTLPDYRVLWFSQSEAPQLTPEYFLARKVGLLEDMESNSHFLLPLNQLKELGVDVSSLHIVYYASYHLLEDAFWRGEVDLISDGEWLWDKAGERQLYSTLIDDASTMGNWYARVNRPPAIDCVLQVALRESTPGLNQSQGMPMAADGGCP